MPARKGRILIVVTSHGELGDTGRKTGFHYEELAAPYLAFRGAGYEVDIASPKGGSAPPDPVSLKAEESERPAPVRRFLADGTARRKIMNTVPFAEVDVARYDAVYFPGGHGTMWDLPENETIGRAVVAAVEEGRVVAAVCHGPAALVAARTRDGTPLVKGKRLNAFTDAEEKAVGLDAVVPFLLESRLRELGARFASGPKWQPYVVRDGNLITGQNPRSAAPLAEAVLAALAERKAAAE